MKAQIFILAVAFGVTSCVSVLPKPGAGPDIFRLSERTLPAQLAASPVLLVELPQAPKALRNNRVAIADGGQGIAYAGGARWAGPAPQLVAELVADALLATSRLNVVTPLEGVRPAFGLVTEIRHFEAVYDNGSEAAPLGKVSIRAKIIDRHSRKLVGQKQFSAQMRASENRLEMIAQAIDTAAHDAATQLGDWVAAELAP